MKNEPIPITIARGDGIGPEIMDSVLAILEAAGANLKIEEIKIGKALYEAGETSGIDDKAWESIHRTKVLLKAPITTPQGGGYKSLNVTIRKSLGLFASVRPARSYFPYVRTKHPGTDIVIVRENEEGLYAGIEYRQTPDALHALKLTTIRGSARIIRYALEYAQKYNREKVTAMTKDNILKHTDGAFHRLFNEIGAEYPDIQKEHYIIDIGTARVADTPERFDVVVTPNLYGDVLSDVSAQITGSVGMAASANIGLKYAMFEAIHGSAPNIAGLGIANPSGLLNGAVLMLLHIGLPEAAEKIQNAWLRTLEDGIHTGDIYNPNYTTVRVNTKEFTDAVIDRLGMLPEKLKPVDYSSRYEKVEITLKERSEPKRELVGVDVVVYHPDKEPKKVGDALKRCETDKLKMSIVSNRGLVVYPEFDFEAFCTDEWVCRFTGEGVSYGDIMELLNKIHLEAGYEVIRTENLYNFDGKRAYSRAQGE